MEEEKRSRDIFRNDLITAVMSAPLVYIPHYHYGYVDAVLHEIFPERPAEEDNAKIYSVMDLYSDAIYECDLKRGPVDFNTKVSLPQRQTVSGLLEGLLAHHRSKGISSSLLEKHCVILLKNVVQMPAEGTQGQSLLDDPGIQLSLQTFAEKYERGDYDPRTTIIMVSPAPVSALPMALKEIVTVIDILPPTFKEIKEKVERVKVSRNLEIEKNVLYEDLCRTLQGLQDYEIDQILHSLRVRTGGFITRRANSYALQEKQRIVRKSGIIEVISPNVTIKNIGGLEVLRKYVEEKAKVFKHLRLAESKEVGLTLPKGLLIIGMPGCGKSMIAKSIAAEFGVSLLRLDISSLMGQYVGQSEENLRRALRTAEAAHPCVLWIDEIEKAFHGANSSNNNESDSLVMRMMGYFLTWMQERKTAVYIVATANDAMRPEFMRRGRFDEVFFVDFPGKEERKAIFQKKMEPFRSNDERQTIFIFDNVDIDQLAEKTEANKGNKGGFSGAEIECVVNTVMEHAFVKYVDEMDKNANAVEKPQAIRVTTEDFVVVLDEMRKSVLCNQAKGKNEAQRSPIDNIREMQEMFNFRDASK